MKCVCLKRIIIFKMDFYRFMAFYLLFLSESQRLSARSCIFYFGSFFNTLQLLHVGWQWVYKA